MKKYFFGVIAVSLIPLLLPLAAGAAGLVPCGESGNPCQLCHLFILFDNIVDFVLFTFVPPVAVLMLVIGGAMFFFAAGNPRYLERGKSVLTSVVMGLALVYGAWLIIGLFFSTIGVASWTGLESGWFTFNCF